MITVSRIEALGVKTIDFMKALLVCGSIEMTTDLAVHNMQKKQVYAEWLSGRVGIDLDYDMIVACVVGLQRELRQFPYHGVVHVQPSGSMFFYNLDSVIKELESGLEKVNWKTGF